MNAFNANSHYEAVSFVLTAQSVRNVKRATFCQETHALSAIRIFHTASNAKTMEAV
jgi:hypothetical protein